MCPICKTKEESIMHIFFDCKAASVYWNSVGWSSYFSPRDTNWLAQVKDFNHNLKYSCINWKSLFPFLLWNIWINRNNNQNNTSNPINVDFIIQRSIEYMLLTENHYSPNKKIPIKIKWLNPQRDGINEILTQATKPIEIVA